MELDNKEILRLKESIKELNDLSSNEKKALIESIEMMWLNSGIQKKKADLKVPTKATEKISRIRQLLAAAWSEDYKDK